MIKLNCKSVLNKIYWLILWLSRAWPVLVLLPILFVHYQFLNYFPENSISINKIISLLMQLFGGVLILYSINKSIWAVNQKSIFNVFITYLKEPFVKKETRISLQVGTANAFGSRAKLSIGRNPKCLEGKIEYLQDQINELKDDLKLEIQELNEKVIMFDTSIGLKLSETKSALGALDSKVDEVFVGGLKLQIFGIFLMSYGAFSGYFA